jgi:Tfp pilus assembly protein PilF
MGKVKWILFGAFCAIVIGADYAIFNSSGAHPAPPSQEKIRAEVAAAGKLLDAWGGNPDILDQARKKLQWVIAVDQQNFVAQAEMARYLLADGYIKNHSARFGKYSNFYTEGEFTPGTLEQAQAYVLYAIHVNPSYADGYVLLGYIQIQRRDLDEAEKSLTKAESLGTNNPWLDLNWALLYKITDNNAASERRWRRVLQSETADPGAKSEAYEYLTSYYIDTDNHDKAVALYEERIKQDPANAWLRGNFAGYLSEIGRYDEAISQARSALAIMDYGIGRRVLATALCQKWGALVANGAGGEAEQYFAEASAVYPRLNEIMAYGASSPGGEQLAKALIMKGVSIDAPAEDGSSALLIATNRNREKVVQTLLKLNANPNLPDRNGWTPLLGAADEGNEKIVKILLARGADPHATVGGWDAPSLAEKRGNAELAAFLKGL